MNLTDLRPYAETGVAAYFAGDWLTGLDCYAAALRLLASWIGG